MISVMLEAAMHYALDGLVVFPCAQKKPLVPAGFKAATLHPETLHEWWTKWPAAQVALPTGVVNRLFVLDVDGPAAAGCVAKMNLPETFAVETSPGHRQLWFRQPAGITTRCTAGALAPGLDTRGDGGYVIAPPSIHHATGRPYQIVRNVPWAEPPRFLLEPPNGGPGSVSADSIPQGRRHQSLLSMAGALRARGLSASSVLEALNAVNEQHCAPPLPIAELEKMAAYVGAKSAGFCGQTMETSAAVDIQCFRDVTPEPLRWLWHKRIPLGKLTLFVGDPDEGKSLTTIDLGARVSRGDRFPDGAASEIGGVIFLSAEDDPSDTQLPRLIAAGAELSRVHRIKAVKVLLADGATGESMFSLERDVEKLEEALTRVPGVRLLVIDPLTAYMGKVDTHRDAEIRHVLAPLAELAARRRVAVISVMHLRKSETSALLRVSGSVGFVAAARAVWGFGEDPEMPGSHVMVCVKNNLAARGDALAYTIEANEDDVPRMAWKPGAVRVDPNDVLAGGPREKRPRGPRQDKAEDWLCALLADGQEKPVTEIMAGAEKAQIAWPTLKRAKQECGIGHVKRGRQWYWVLA